MGGRRAGQFIRRAGKVAGRSSRHAGSHRKVCRLRRRAVGLSIDATRRSYPLTARTLRLRVAGSLEKGISGEEKMSAPGASSKNFDRPLLAQSGRPYASRAFELATIKNE